MTKLEKEIVAEGTARKFRQLAEVCTHTADNLNAETIEAIYNDLDLIATRLAELEQTLRKMGV